MAVFSTNQNRQFYFADSLAEAKSNVAKGNGKVYVGSDKDGNVYLLQGGKAGLVRSDLIDPKSVTYAKHSLAASMARKLKKVTLALDSNVNEGKVIPGEDYIVRLNFYQAGSMSDEDIFQKYGAVQGTSAMVTTEAIFWQAMAYSLVKNFKRLYAPLVTISFTGGSAGTNAIASASYKNGTYSFKDASGSAITTTGATGIVITEADPSSEWKLGTAKLTQTRFEVIPTTVFDDGVQVVWGTATEGVASSTVPNGYELADLEYFCMGERGDQYRNIGWPNVIPTEYFIGTSGASTGYDVLDIHYAYQGSCEDIQKSEKDIIIVGSAAAIKAINNALVTAGIPGLTTEA